MPPSLTSARPTPQQYRAALLTGLLLGLVTALTLPYARLAGPYIPAFLPMYAALASAADLVTAYLLFGQFLSTRTPSLAALAATYLYSGTIILPYLLTFPNVFAPHGLLDAGPQTAVWLWTCWHGGFPLGLLLYAALDWRDRRVHLAPSTARRLTTLLAALVPALVVALSLVAIRAEPHLPVLVRGTHFTALFSLTSPLGLTLCGLAVAACGLLIAQVRGRSASVAGVWLTVAALACLFDIGINLWVPSRYTVGWYVSRADTVLSASVVLSALLYEVTRLYARLARANADLQASERRLRALSAASAGQNRALLDAIPDTMLHLNREGLVLNYKGALDDPATAPETVLGKPVSAILPAEQARHVLQAMDAARRAGAVQTFEYALPLGGETRHHEARVVGCGGEETMIIVRDVSARTRLEATLRHQALHDALTGLPNRTLLHDRLQAELHVAQSSGRGLALLLLDLDRFKEINDTFGHPVGDRVLEQVAARLQGVLRAADTVARLGGDEFAVVLPGTDRSGAEQSAHRLRAALEAPFTVEEVTFHVGSSVGGVLCPEHGSSAEALLRRVDVAMYVAKQAGGGYSLYRAERDEHSPQRHALSVDLRRALDRDELLLHYQPQVGLATGRLCGVEALVRWRHPEHGLIPPGQFIPLAEHTGLIAPLARWVLEAALRQCQAWRAAGLDLSVAVNLSMANLRDPTLAEAIARLLQAYGVPPALLRLELTESTLMTDVQHTLAVLTPLSGMGMGLSVDDFGTGYSSLAYLKRLPVDELKIDMAFVRHMGEDAADATIVRSTIGLGKSLGLQVVAEGVENQRSWEQLAAWGCDVAQGYYLSRPLPAAELTQWMRTSRWGIADGAAELTA